MNKKIGSLMVLLLGLLLLVYSGARSLDFIMLTLPADQKIMAWFGLAALDGGLICWALAYLHGSKGGWQRAISLLMVLVDLVGCVAMFTLDTLYSAGSNGITASLTPAQMQNAVLALSGIIALNIAATVAHHLTDPEKMREKAEEEAFSKVEDETLKQISENASQLAAALAPTLAADWMAKTSARYTAHLSTAPAQPATAPAQPTTKRKVFFKRPTPLKNISLNANTIAPGKLKKVASTKRPVKPTIATVQKP